MAKHPSPLHLDEALLQDFRARLAQWFGEHARSLPWRDTQDPYAIWLSEIILQQTQVVQGMSYYHKFLELFPTVYDLAQASEDEVLRAWQGLGYYSRGRNLLKAAQMVVSDFGGSFPDSIEQIKKLPGVGPYTQAAILSFAYNKPHAAVDGNVYRVLSRVCAEAMPIDTTEGQRHYRALAEVFLDRQEPGRHNQAMIELGALVCNPRKPNCLFCPVEAFCQGLAEGNPTSYPIKVGKISLRHRYLSFCLVRLPEGKILLERREGKDIWQGLYQFPLIETAEPLQGLDALTKNNDFAALLQDLDNPIVGGACLAEREHRLTHQLLHASLYGIEAEAYQGTRYLAVPLSALHDYGLPALLVKLLSDITPNYNIGK